jgi:hypothetical protein
MYIKRILLLLSPIILYKYRYSIFNYTFNFLYWIKNINKNNKLILKNRVNKEEYDIINYTFNNQPYIMLLDKYTIFNFNYDFPYNNNMINNFHKSPDMVKKNTDIIMSNTILDNSDEIDSIDAIRKICDPMCKFYKNTKYKLSKKNIINYLKDTLVFQKKNKIKENKIMTCDGEEFDLLEI